MSEKFKIYHWDTFDNETLLIKESNSLKKAQKFVENRYKGRISPNGADKVQIVNDGKVVMNYLII